MEEKWIIDRSHPFDSIAHVNVKKRWFWRNAKITVILHETFLDYLKDFVPDDDERKELLQSNARQMIERFLMQTDKNNPFYGDDPGFEHYCRVKYKKLYDHIIHMIDNLERVSQR